MLDMVALWTLGALQLTFERQGGLGRFMSSEMVSKYENRFCPGISLTRLWQISYILFPLKFRVMTDYERHGIHLAPFEAKRRIYPTTISNTQLGVVPRTLIE